MEDSTLSITCVVCQTVNVSTKDLNSFRCMSCETLQDLVCFDCCPSQKGKVAIPRIERKVQCNFCASIYRRMMCCDNFVLQKSNETLIICNDCNQVCAICVCDRINRLPPTSMCKQCENCKCKITLIHCNCGEKLFHEFVGNVPYKCKCEWEFEYGVDIGVQSF